MAMVIAIRQALDYTSTLRAIGVATGFLWVKSLVTKRLLRMPATFRNRCGGTIFSLHPLE